MHRTFGMGLLVLAACKQPAASSTTDAGVAPVASLVVVDASADAGADAGARAAEVPPPNLLELVPAKIAVSSTVQNPHDFPEHLLDGKLETAWNGKTGDLVGGWIRFKIPADAKVSYVELTAGYTRVTKDADLFLANHRIKRLQITHNGKKLGEHALDPSSRAMQRIPIAELCGTSCGGEFELKVLEVEPGTKKEWRELVISELRVVGEPGKQREAEAAVPRIGVASYTAYPPQLPPVPLRPELPGTFTDLAAACAAWPPIGKRLAAEGKEAYAMFGGPKKGEPTCREEALDGALVPDAAFLGASSLRLSDGYGTWSVPVVQTPRGWSVIGFRYNEVDTPDPGCPSIVRPVLIDDAPKVQSGWLVLQTGNTQTQYTAAPEGSGRDDNVNLVLLRGAVWCKEFAGSLACKQYHPQYQPALATKTASSKDPWAKQGWDAIPWRDAERFTIDVAGDLRLH